MARSIDQNHRRALVEAVATSFVTAGSARASLRELGAEVGASARMLMHHFGTRDQLVDLALGVARERQLAAARSAIVPGPDALAVLDATWAWFESSETRQYFALFTEVAAQERAVPADERRFGARLGSDWRPLFEAVFDADDRFASDAPALALLVVGLLRGFALDLDAGDDAHGREQAFAMLAEMIAAGARSR